MYTLLIKTWSLIVWIVGFKTFVQIIQVWQVYV
jgi:hypothetical protein